MKNLKKVLALVLVVAMMASFAVSASAATFTDNDKIVYDDAVKLLSDLDVVNGFTDGSFNPEGNVTRAQMAKMIAFIMNGGEDASSSFASAANFNDVANGYWAANSIGYCATKDIVAGAGNNLYYPNNDVTGVQIAKMALVALGYDPTIEGLTGSAWAINTIDLAEDAGLFDDMGKDFNASAAASRQEAAQILYNMLLSEMVCYTDNGTNIVIGDITINTDATRKYMKENGEGTDTKSEAIPGIVEYFDVVNNEINDGDDDYGRPARIIKIKGLDDDIVLANDADYTYEGKVKGGDVYSDIGKAAADYKLTVWVDGEKSEDLAAEGADGWKDLLEKSESSKLGYTGATTEVFVDKDAEKLTIVVINQYLAQVDSINENDDDEDLLDISFTVYGGDNRTLEEQEAFGYEEDDYVLVTLGSDDTIDVIGAPETVEGIADSQSGDYYKVDGTKYNLSDSLNENPADGDKSGTYTFYLDQMGNIVGSTEIAAGTSASKYLYVSKTQAGNDIDGAWVKAQVDFTDGTSATITLETKNTKPAGQDTKTDCYKNPVTGDWTKIEEKAAGEDAVFASGFYSYSENSDGEYTLKALDTKYAVSESADIVDILSGDSKMGSFDGKTLYATSSTKLYLVDSDTVYTGYKNFPEDVDGDDLNILMVRSSRNSENLSSIFVFGDDGANEKLNIAMYTGIYEDRDDLYAEFYVDGTREFKKISDVTDEDATGADKTGLVKEHLYELDGDSANALDDGDVVYEGSLKYKVVSGKITENTNDSKFVIDGVDYLYGYDDDELLIYDATKDGKAASLSRNKEVTVAYITDGGVNYALVAYITD